MTWDELCEKAKYMGYEFHKSGCFLQRPDSGFQFYNDGQIYVENEYDSILATDYRTPEQMLAIMEALR